MNGKAQAGESESAPCIVHLRSNLVYLQHPKQAFLEQKTFDLDHGMKGFDRGMKGFDRGMKGFDRGNKGFDRGNKGFDRGNKGFDRGMKGFAGGMKGLELGDKGLARQTGLRARKTLYLQHGKACFMAGTRGFKRPSHLQRVQFGLGDFSSGMIGAQFLEAN